ncbi:unnamed protein product [Rotaria magnacalcarata]|uniref:Uncharacterized protein n=1 Tax=Rotaria magnacalcarata TaxID=392030 RepID=A0A815I6W1_9BILA|nr:unnamed protein product [Rotaria magnacalcarata]
MAGQSSSNFAEQMDSHNQLDSVLSLPENHNVSFGNTENFADEPIGVYSTSHLLDAAIFILSNGTCQNADIPRDSQYPVQFLNEVFDHLATLKSTPQGFYRELITAYVEMYKIDLHLIALDTNNKYIIIGKNELFDSNEVPIDQKNHAFIYCDLENDIYNPWFYRNISNGENRTVFTKDDELIWQSIATRIGRKNEENNTIQMGGHFSVPSNDLSNTVSENNLPPENHSMILDQQPSVRIEANVCVERILQQLWDITQAATPLLSRTVLQANIPVQLADTNNVEQINQNVSNIAPFSETHLTSTTHIAQTASLPTPASFQYNAPPIKTQPKQDWHYRSMKDLGRTGFPIIAGVGPQRTLISVKVPPQMNDKMYLGIKIVTYNDREHRSKVPVPKGTTVDVTDFSKDNNLNRLQFFQCNQTDYFDPNNRYVYSDITADEHQAERKE